LSAQRACRKSLFLNPASPEFAQGDKSTAVFTESITAQKAFCKGSDAGLREFPFPSNHFMTDYSLSKSARILGFPTASTLPLSRAATDITGNGSPSHRVGSKGLLEAVGINKITNVASVNTGCEITKNMLQPDISLAQGVRPT
jgi:hypothetical protein